MVSRLARLSSTNQDHSSLVLWEFCLRHPEVRDVCDIGQMLFWNKKWAWWATAVMFLLNNTVSSIRQITACFLSISNLWSVHSSSRSVRLDILIYSFSY